MKLKKTTIVLIIVCLAGLSLLLYPKLSDYWNSKHTAEAMASYDEFVENLDEEDFEKLWAEVNEYNSDLLERENPMSLDDAMKKRYMNILKITNEGVMGYIEIPKIGVQLPIYHTCEDYFLQRAVGHIEWSSLPVGGASTHAVLSGHRGLPSAKLFTALDELREGDTFSITVLDDVLTYEVDQIRIVEPENTSDLQIEEGKDLCTLLTCTPYGINTHRLLVRGHRVETQILYDERVVSEVVVIDPLIVAPCIAIPLLFVLLMIVVFKKPKNKGNGAEKQKKKRQYFADGGKNQ